MCHAEQTTEPTDRAPQGAFQRSSLPAGRLEALTGPEVADLCLALETRATACEALGASGAEWFRALAQKISAAGGVYLARASTSSAPPGRGLAGDRSGRSDAPPERPGDAGDVTAGIAERELAVTPALAPTLMQAASRALGVIERLKAGAAVDRGEVLACVRYTEAAVDALVTVPPGGLHPALLNAWYALRLYLKRKVSASQLTADDLLRRMGAKAPPLQVEPLAVIGQGEYAREIPGRDAEPAAKARSCQACGRTEQLRTHVIDGKRGVYCWRHGLPGRREVAVACSMCGSKFSCDEETANGPAPVLCDACDAGGGAS